MRKDIEIHSQEFLRFVAENEKRLKNNLKKNITYNEDIFDDVFQDTILDIYDYITQKEKFIDDFEQFFFICSKRKYIAQDTKTKKKLETDNRTYFDEIEQGIGLDDDDMETFNDIYNDEEYDINETKWKNINILYDYIKTRLEEVFDDKEVDVYIIYFRLKSEKTPMSYKKLADVMNADLKWITTTIQKLKKYVKNDEKINEMKKKLLND